MGNMIGTSRGKEFQWIDFVMIPNPLSLSIDTVQV